MKITGKTHKQQNLWQALAALVLLIGVAGIFIAATSNGSQNPFLAWCVVHGWQLFLGCCFVYGIVQIALLISRRKASASTKLSRT
jgi:nitrogen fixation/metabolism regulation signal transduction histidine kinase